MGFLSGITRFWTQMNADLKDFKYIDLTETQENSLRRASAKISVPM